ncbi:MAG: hypothetical protein RLZZ40_774 [Actinomycetota bacterium]|jgi:uncharacterized Tic20 family protein
MTDNPYKQTGPMTPGEEKGWAIGQYLGALFLDVFSPLIAYILFRERGPFIESHSKEHLNFSLTIVLAYIVLAISIVGWLIIWVPFVAAIAFRIVGAYKASQGELYNFPITIRFIK